MKAISRGFVLCLLVTYLKTSFAHGDLGGSHLYLHDEPDTPIATLNGEVITAGEYEVFAQMRDRQLRQSGQSSVASFEKILDEIIIRKLATQYSEKHDLDKKEELVNRLAAIKAELLFEAGIKHFLEANPVTDEELQTAYSAMVADNVKYEYKARHILLKTKAEADTVIEALNNGEDFVALAKKHSKDTGTADAGGDLGWFELSNMAKPVSDAVAKLENGKYGEQPVDSGFGWHVIKREERREVPAITFEAAKTGLLSRLQAARYEEYLKSLRQQADINVIYKPSH